MGLVVPQHVGSYPRPGIEPASSVLEGRTAGPPGKFPFTVELVKMLPVLGAIFKLVALAPQGIPIHCFALSFLRPTDTPFLLSSPTQTPTPCGSCGRCHFIVTALFRDGGVFLGGLFCGFCCKVVLFSHLVDCFFYIKILYKSILLYKHEMIALVK